MLCTCGKDWETCSCYCSSPLAECPTCGCLYTVGPCPDCEEENEEN